jgi:pilus assembly protein CpaB
MRSNNLIILGVAIVLGAIAAVLARNWLATHARSNQSGVGTIVVASAPLTFGAQLTAENTTEIPWSTAVLPEGAYATKQALLKDGRRMALALIARNEPILRSKITSPNQPATLSSILAPGKRAVTVRVDDVRGVAGFIQPGDLVDVVLIRTEADSRSNDSYSEVILQSAKVLAIDQITGEHTEQPTIAKAVTLEVGVQDAQKILLATNIGRLSLILRQPAGASNDQVRRITERDLGNAPPERKVAAELPPAAAPVVQAPPAAPAKPARPRPPEAETKQITIWHGMKPQEYDRPLYGGQSIAGEQPAEGVE